MRTPPDHTHPRLVSLLFELFDSGQLRHFLSKGVEGVQILRSIPGPDAPPAEQFDAAAACLLRRGLVARPLVLAMLTARPDKADSIVTFAETAGVRTTPEERAAATAEGSETGRHEDPEVMRLTELLSRLEPQSEDFDGIARQLRDRKRALLQAPHLHPGETLGDGRFLLLWVQGTGGFADVWKARDLHSADDVVVAVKVLHSQWSRDRTRIDRFYRGVRAMSGLRHPSIVKIVAAAREERGFHFYVMEWMSDGDLEDWLAERDPLPWVHVRNILRQISEALVFTHERGVIHRDIKPENVLIGERGELKLSDFDLVELAHSTAGTRTGAFGTFLYAAPEAMDNGALSTVRSDVYSLGMLGLRAAAGRPLSYADKAKVPNLLGEISAPYWFLDALNKALQSEADKRHATMRDFWITLDPPSERSFRFFYRELLSPFGDAFDDSARGIFIGGFVCLVLFCAGHPWWGIAATLGITTAAGAIVAVRRGSPARGLRGAGLAAYLSLFMAVMIYLIAVGAWTIAKDEGWIAALEEPLEELRDRSFAVSEEPTVHAGE